MNDLEKIWRSPVLQNASFATLLYSVLYLLFLTATKNTDDHFKGFILLYSIPLLAIAAFSLHGDIIANIIPRNFHDISKICLVIFIAYLLIMAVKYPIHSISMSYLKQLFNRLIIGIILGYLVFGRYNSWNRDPDSANRTQRRVDIACCLVATAIIALISAWISQSMRSDSFLLRPEFASAYQVFGDYLILAYVCYVTILYRNISHLIGRRVAYGLGWSIALSVVTLGLVLLAQAIGSNEATIAILVLGIGFGIVHVVRCVRENARTGWRIAAASTIAALLLAVGFIALLTLLPPLRILNFNQLDLPDSQATAALPAPPQQPGAQNPAVPTAPPSSPSVASASTSATPSVPPPSKSSMISNSFISRINIWRSLAGEQFAYSPIFGDLGVDQVLGHPGYYVHSVASIQTHLGAIGSLLFLGFILERLVNLYRFGTDALLKVTAPIILAGAVVATFFTWLPLWFVVGALYAPRTKSDRRASTVGARDAQLKTGAGL